MKAKERHEILAKTFEEVWNMDRNFIGVSMDLESNMPVIFLTEQGFRKKFKSYEIVKDKIGESMVRCVNNVKYVARTKPKNAPN